METDRKNAERYSYGKVHGFPVPFWTPEGTNWFYRNLKFDSCDAAIDHFISAEPH